MQIAMWLCVPSLTLCMCPKGPFHYVHLRTAMKRCLGEKPIAAAARKAGPCFWPRYSMQVKAETVKSLKPVPYPKGPRT